MKKLQTLANADNKRFVNIVLNIFAVCANSKFQIVRYKINPIESLSVNCFVNFYASESAFSTLQHVS